MLTSRRDDIEPGAPASRSTRIIRQSSGRPEPERDRYRRDVSDPHGTALERAMVGELLTISAWIESLPDDQIDIDVAVRIQEDIAFVIDKLSDEDRDAIVHIATGLADERDASRSGDGDGVRRSLVAFGLLEEP
jgi:hypothetical protein